MTPTKNNFSHVKIVLAGLLATRSLVRGTADIVYHAVYPDQKARNQAVMNYFYSLGLPSAVIFDDLSNLLESVFPPPAAEMAADTFPIDLDYDQNNCDYSALISGAADLDHPTAT